MKRFVLVVIVGLACAFGMTGCHTACVNPDMDDGSRYCNGNQLMECQDGAWALHKDCSSLMLSCEQDANKCPSGQYPNNVCCWSPF